LRLAPARLGSIAQKTPSEFAKAISYEVELKAKKEKKELTDQEKYDLAMEQMEKEKRGQLTPAEKAAFDRKRCMKALKS